MKQIQILKQNINKRIEETNEVYKKTKVTLEGSTAQAVLLNDIVILEILNIILDKLDTIETRVVI